MKFEQDKLVEWAKASGAMCESYMTTIPKVIGVYFIPEDLAKFAEKIISEYEYSKATK